MVGFRCGSVEVCQHYGRDRRQMRGKLGYHSICSMEMRVTGDSKPGSPYLSLLSVGGVRDFGSY